MTLVKICGLTRRSDAVAAVDAGADAIGFVFVDSSPRCVSAAQARDLGAALPADVLKVGVFVNMPRAAVQSTAIEANLDVIQFHGDESPLECLGFDRDVWKRFKIAPDATAESLRTEALPYRVAAFLLDPGAGSGETFEWTLARGIDTPRIIAGGLTCDNVARAMIQSGAWGVDVSSGVETAPGEKDPVMIQHFIDAVRRADDCHGT